MHPDEAPLPHRSRAWLATLSTLWVIGLAGVLLVAGNVAGSAIVPDRGKLYDWIVYFLVGLGVPALGIVLPVAWARFGWPGSLLARLHLVLSGFGVACAAAFIAASWHRFGLAAALLTLLLATLQTIAVDSAGAKEIGRFRHLAVDWLVALLAWSALLPLGLLDLVRPPFFLAGFLAALAIVVLAARGTGIPAEVPRPGRMANVLAIVLIALMSLRTEHLFEQLGDMGAMHHWGAWTGSVDLMRQGGWLLWDTPAHYGILDTAILASVPRPSWDALYLVEAASFLIVGFGMYTLARRVDRGWIGWVFGLVVACAIPMYTRPWPGSIDALAVHVLPNWGPFRYLPCFLLLFWLALERRTGEGAPRYRQVLVGGAILWLVGVLWSPESAFCCSAAFIPAWTVIAIRRGMRSPRPLRVSAGWLLLPVVLLGAAIAGMKAIWMIGNGAGPDWIAILDYVIGGGVQIFFVKQQLLGPATGILLGFCMVATAAAYCSIRLGIPNRDLAFWLGMLGMFWSVCAYAFQRGGRMLHPIAFAIIIVVLAEAVRHRGEWPSWGSLVRAGSVPLLVLPVIAPLAAFAANPGATGEAVASLVATARNGFAVSWMIPDEDEQLQQLLRDAGATADTPLWFAGNQIGNVMKPWTPAGGDRVLSNPQWTPGHPMTMLHYLPEGHAIPYLARWIERFSASGWLIRSRTGPGADAGQLMVTAGMNPDVMAEILRTHVPTRVRQNSDWIMTWFEYVGADAAASRPVDAAVDRQALPPDVLVHGVPLADEVAPEVWALFGEGWRNLSLDGRQGTEGARLWVYTPDARTIRLEVPVTDVPNNTMLRLDESGAMGAGGTVVAEIALTPGWNAVTFNLVDTPEDGGARKKPAGKAEETAKDERGRQSGRRARDRAATPVPPSPTHQPAMVATPVVESSPSDSPPAMTQSRTSRRFMVGPIRIDTGD